MRYLLLMILLIIGEGMCEPISVANNDHISSMISPVKLTRIAVEDDRIIDAFLGQENVVIEKDERLGQLYLMPKDGALEASITIVTEKGLNFDLTLEVSEKADSAIILKPKNAAKFKSKAPSPTASSPTAGLAVSEPFQKQILALIRDLYDHKDDGDGGEDRTYPGFYTVAKSEMARGDFTATIYKLENHQDNTAILNEMEFVREGDVAIAFLSPTLDPKDFTYLLVVRRV